jgi:thiol-disulfide isomerase/thioredoxin
MRRTLGLLVVAALLLISGCASKGDDSGAKLAPDFRVESIAEPGKIVKLSDFKGKVVLLDFWATWCGPCRVISPELDKFATKYGPQGFVVLGISDEARPIVEKYAKEEKPGHELYLDLLNNANNAYPGEYIPRLYVIDREGKIAYAETMTTSDPVSEAEKAIQASLKV